MDITIKAIPVHVRMASGEALTMAPTADQKVQLSFGMEIPHILNMRSGIATMILPSTCPIASEDMLHCELSVPVMVTEVVERRKARGDWSLNPFDQGPDWIMVRYV